MAPPIDDAAIDEVVQQVVRAAKRSLVVERAILFGSRARADARADSDIDLAIEHASSDAQWAEFVNEMAEQAPTLLALDLVDLARADPPLRARILREGRVVHG
jgi:predicted nucleotidyltransferase